MAEPKKILSASRIKTLETCSWSYWCNYNLKLPQKQNEGALRGTVCHLIFEMLIKKKHKKHFTLVTENKSIKGSPAVLRLVLKHLVKMENSFSLPMTNDDNYNLIDEMILVGLNYDFFGEGGSVDSPEYEFLLESEDPKYKIRGFMDKPIDYEDKLKIVDYKSSKYKFRGEELTSNVQAMAYSLAARKIWPHKKSLVEFLFLRFPRKPSQILEFNDDQLLGFEYFLAEVYKKINSFSLEDAKANYAKDSYKNAWLCKIGAWRCPYIDGYTYWQLTDKDNKVISKSLKNDLVAGKGQKIVEKSYEGCPAHKRQSDEDLFDF